jgi:hypothetical protein
MKPGARNGPMPPGPRAVPGIFTISIVIAIIITSAMATTPVEAA